MGLEIDGEVVGGMPFRAFFQEFLPCADEAQLAKFLADIPTDLFNNIPTTSRKGKSSTAKKRRRTDEEDSESEEDTEDENEEGVKEDEEDVEEDEEVDEASAKGSLPRVREADMYPTLIKLLNEHRVCPGFTFLDNSKSGDPNSRTGRRWAPDVGLYKDGEEPAKPNRPDFNRIAMGLEIKPAGSERPFHDAPPGLDQAARRLHQYLPDRNSKAFETLGQLASVMTEICSRQFRTHVFMVYLRDPDVCFIRADRSGVLVSTSINYRQQSKLLAEFFWRFSKATDAQRGMDTTVHSPTDDEIILAKTHLKSDSKLERPIVRIDVPDGEGLRSVLAWEALCDPESLTGRGSRPIPVYDLKAKAVRFLKDSWRSEMLEKETAILAQLNEAKVPNVPKCVAGGDIYDQNHFPYHRTVTQKYVNADWRSGPLLPLEARVHHRILEDLILSSINDCKNAREMMLVLRDALLAHRRAYELGILHRDISDNNVLLVRKADDSVAGVLADWDMALKFERDSAQNVIPPTTQRQRHRTGTWYFMSARLLRDGTQPHTLQDDLESFFHLALYLSIFWFPHTGAKSSLQEFTSNVFEQYRFSQGLGQFIGGIDKVMMFSYRDHIGKIDFTSNTPLTKWVNEVFEPFQDSYRIPYGPQERHLHSHDFIVERFTEVLNLAGWSNEKITSAPEPVAKPKRRYVDEEKPKKKKPKKSTSASDSVYRPSSSLRQGGSGSGSRPSVRSRKATSSGV
ncbi:hypothetical protein CPB83DRAFT_851555 [Crepidotus variabilis]|uniref:Protein kinase domain-containing protein n=1 Tax=Crepidotus variabilis TaxID=179855 RepID=A0A9P6EJM6_9AGAR|nr:hypothetical protein CPB83DRAFT_851555 [Crepidotus variabilis]